MPPRLRALLLAGLSLLLSVTGHVGTAARSPGPSPDRASWPLDPVPRVVAGFDPPSVPWGPGHRGVDLAGHPGARVHAALAGTVGFAGTVAGRGVVVVDHGGRRTTYQPVAATVHTGDRVAAGDRLGLLRLFGSHCLPRACLHWGLLVGEDYRDPLSLVRAGPVRLLPLDRRITRPLVRPQTRRSLPVDALAPSPDTTERPAAAAALSPAGRAAGWRQARG